MYKCPHCGKFIKEVNVVELSVRQLVVSAGLGFGIGLFVYPLVGEVSAAGGFIVASLLTFLLLRRQ